MKKSQFGLIFIENTHFLLPFMFSIALWSLIFFSVFSNFLRLSGVYIQAVIRKFHKNAGIISLSLFTIDWGVIRGL